MHRTYYKNKIQSYKPLDKHVQQEQRKIQQLQSSSLEGLWLIPKSAPSTCNRRHTIPGMSGRVSCCSSPTISSKMIGIGFFFLLMNISWTKLTMQNLQTVTQTFPQEICGTNYLKITQHCPSSQYPHPHLSILTECNNTILQQLLYLHVQVFQRSKITIQDKPDCFDTYSKLHNNTHV